MRPRIRTIKPELWDSPDVVALSDSQVLFWIWLITQADDEGRMHGGALLLSYRYHRLNKRWVYGALTAFIQRHMIQIYVVGSNEYLQITNWSDHQKVDRPSNSKLPAPPVEQGGGSNADSSNPRRILVESSSDARAPRARPRIGSDRIGSDRINTVDPEGELFPPNPPPRKAPPRLPRRVREHMNYGAALEEAAERLEARGE